MLGCLFTGAHLRRGPRFSAKTSLSVRAARCDTFRPHFKGPLWFHRQLAGGLDNLINPNGLISIPRSHQSKAKSATAHVLAVAILLNLPCSFEQAPSLI